MIEQFTGEQRDLVPRAALAENYVLALLLLKAEVTETSFVFWHSVTWFTVLGKSPAITFCMMWCHEPLYLFTHCGDQRECKRSVSHPLYCSPSAPVFIFPNYGVWVRSRYGRLLFNNHVVFSEGVLRCVLESSFVPIPESAEHITWIILFLRCEWLYLLISRPIPFDS